MVHSQVPTWSRPRYQTSTTLQPTVSHSPSACTTQGSVPPSLHRGPSGCTTTLPGLQHRPTRKSQSIVAPGVPASLRGLQVPSRPHTREPIPTLLPPGLQPSPRQPKEKCTHTQIHLGSMGKLCSLGHHLPQRNSCSQPGKNEMNRMEN
jgi:hypothetical protein